MRALCFSTKKLRSKTEVVLLIFVRLETVFSASILPPPFASISGVSRLVYSTVLFYESSAQDSPGCLHFESEREINFPRLKTKNTTVRLFAVWGYNKTLSFRTVSWKIGKEEPSAAVSTHLTPATNSKTVSDDQRWANKIIRQGTVRNEAGHPLAVAPNVMSAIRPMAQKP